MATADTDVKTGLVKALGLTDATTLVMGSMIGSGIFIVSADIARQVDSPGLLILVWLIGAALTIAAALSYGELAAAMPHAGGQYVYLREALAHFTASSTAGPSSLASRPAPSPPWASPSPRTPASFSPGYRLKNNFLARGKLAWPRNNH